MIALEQMGGAVTRVPDTATPSSNAGLRAYDPGNFFRLNQNIEPAAG